MVIFIFYAWHGRWDEAESALCRAALLLQSALGARHPYIGLVVNLLGEDVCVFVCVCVCVCLRVCVCVCVCARAHE